MYLIVNLIVIGIVGPVAATIGRQQHGGVRGPRHSGRPAVLLWRHHGPLRATGAAAPVVASTPLP